MPSGRCEPDPRAPARGRIPTPRARCARRSEAGGEPACRREARVPGLRSERAPRRGPPTPRSEEHTSELQSQFHLVCRLLLEKKKKKIKRQQITKKKNDIILSVN